METKSYNKLYIYCNISLLLAAFISGLSFVAQKLGMNYVGPFTFNTLRCFIGGISLLPALYIPAETRINIKGGIIAGFVLFLAFSINQYCMIYADAGKAGFITSLYILFVPIIAIFLKQKLKYNVIISILISLIGLYLLCVNEFKNFALWDILLLISAFFFALHIIIVSHYSKKSNAIKLSIIQFITAGFLSLPLMYMFETPTINNILLGWQPILFIGIIVTGLAYTLQIFGHKATKPILATLILSSEAIFAVLGGIFILNETLDFKEIIGGLLMLSAIIISQIQNKKEVSNEKDFETNNQ